MSKLNQIIAVTPTKKSAAEKAKTEVYHLLQKSDLLNGFTRTYAPKDDEGEKLPAENKVVQVRVKDVLKSISTPWAEMFDVVATQDWANTRAKASVVVDGVAVVKDAPVTYLLFLEKQLTDLHTFVEKLPTLDLAETWEFSSDADLYASKPSQSLKTKKVLKNHVKAEATEKHPAQVETYTEDVTIGYWTTRKFSGALPVKEKNEMLERVNKLRDAVKVAREEANSMVVETQKVGASVLKFVFGKV